jgi:hypothetical protein
MSSPKNLLVVGARVLEEELLVVERLALLERIFDAHQHVFAWRPFAHFRRSIDETALTANIDSIELRDVRNCLDVLADRPVVEVEAAGLALDRDVRSGVDLVLLDELGEIGYTVLSVLFVEVNDHPAVWRHDAHSFDRAEALCFVD